MFPHLLSLGAARDGRQAGPKERGPHRLAAAAQAAPDAVAPLSPRSPSTRLAAAAPSSSSVGSPRARAAALPAYRALLGRQTQRLPHVQHAAERAPTRYTSLDGLRKLGELHTGKHSQVCHFLDTRSGQLVAVKTYYKRTMAKRHYRNVRREIAISRLLAKQRFTGAVQLLGAFEDDSHIYLVQESCAGGDLYKRLVRAGGVLSEGEVARDVVVPLLLTLTFLHANNIVHRDIKPENVFFTAENGLRLGDFGLAIDAAKERPTSRVGTLDYMAPEVVGMPSPDTIKRLGLAPHQVGHYGCKVDVWALGILTYELICGRPPFEVEDVRLTEQQIQFGEVVFPEHLVSPLCRSFIQQALTKRPESRPSAAQLFQHPWVQAQYRQLAAEQRQSAAAALVAAPGAAMCTPELRRTVSQPPSPSKSVPGVLPLGMGQGGEGARTPAAVASALAPFLPPSQAKQAHKVRLLSPGRPPSSGKGVGQRRRRLSDPLSRVHVAAAPEAVVAAAVASAAAPEAAAPEVPPATPPPASTPAAASDGAGAVAAAADLDDAAASGRLAAEFETPGTPGVQVTPLPRQRPVVVPPPRFGPLGRGPFSLPPLSTPGASSIAAAAAGEGVPQPAGGPLRRPAAAGRSRFAAAAENDEASAVATLRQSSEASFAAGLSSPGQLHARSGSVPSLVARQEGSSGDLTVCGRAASFSSFRSPSGGSLSLQVAARASSFTSFGGSSSNLSNIMGSRPSSSKQLDSLEEAGGAGGHAADAASDQLRRLHLAG